MRAAVLDFVHASPKSETLRRSGDPVGQRC
jgi:hypothetical protein